VQIVGVEAGGKGLDGRPALCLADRRFAGRAAWQPHLPAAGCRRPDQGRSFDFRRPRLSRHRPEHAWLHEIGRAEYVPIMDDEALEAFQL
jgi:tryptophan synthase beta chain